MLQASRDNGFQSINADLIYGLPLQTLDSFSRTLDQLIELEWVRGGRRRQTPGRPVTFVVTEAFLDHFGLENARDLPGLAELRAAGLLESRPPEQGAGSLFPTRGEDDEDDPTVPAEDLFEDE